MVLKRVDVGLLHCNVKSQICAVTGMLETHASAMKASVESLKHDCKYAPVVHEQKSCLSNQPGEGVIE
jgi:hypothetical protein